MHNWRLAAFSNLTSGHTRQQTTPSRQPSQDLFVPMICKCGLQRGQHRTYFHKVAFAVAELFLLLLTVMTVNIVCNSCGWSAAIPYPQTTPERTLHMLCSCFVSVRSRALRWSTCVGACVSAWAHHNTYLARVCSTSVHARHTQKSPWLVRACWMHITMTINTQCQITCVFFID